MNFFFNEVNEQRRNGEAIIFLDLNMQTTKYLIFYPFGETLYWLGFTFRMEVNRKLDFVVLTHDRSTLYRLQNNGSLANGLLLFFLSWSYSPWVYYLKCIIYIANSIMWWSDKFYLFDWELCYSNFNTTK